MRLFSLLYCPVFRACCCFTSAARVAVFFRSWSADQSALLAAYRYRSCLLYLLVVLRLFSSIPPIELLYCFGIWGKDLCSCGRWTTSVLLVLAGMQKMDLFPLESCLKMKLFLVITASRPGPSRKVLTVIEEDFL